jgi:uncharacterized cupredoxin-like copper-binding protein
MISFAFRCICIASLSIWAMSSYAAPAFGEPGTKRDAARTVKVELADTMRFTPSSLTVTRGETIRFDLKNRGKVMHEFVLGSMQDLRAHAEMMKKHPGMEHDEPFMAHVAPGKTRTLVWRFTKPGEFHYGCLIAGHFEAGMVGTITVK